MLSDNLINNIIDLYIDSNRYQKLFTDKVID